MLHLAEQFELFWDVFTGGSEISFSAFHTVDAVGDVVAQSVHEGQFDASSFDHRLVVFLAQPAIDQRRYDRAIRIPLPEGLLTTMLFGGVTEHYYVTRLFPCVQQPAIELFSAGRSKLTFSHNVRAGRLR